MPDLTGGDVALRYRNGGGKVPLILFSSEPQDESVVSLFDWVAVDKHFSALLEAYHKIGLLLDVEAG